MPAWLSAIFILSWNDVLEVVGYNLNDKEDVSDNVSGKNLPNANSPVEDLKVISLLTATSLDYGDEWK